MASLRRFPRSPYWFACFTMPDGRRAQRSTKETKRKPAQDKADSWELLSKERAKAKQSHKVISEIYRTAHGADLPDATAREFFTSWLARRKSEVAPASYAAYSARATHFLDWLKDMASLPIGELEKKHFVAYRDHLQVTLSAATVNNGIKILRGILEDARRDGHVHENPSADCPMVKKAPTVKRRPFTEDELRAVLAVSDGEWRSMILFGIYVGQRLVDLVKLTWSSVDLKNSEVRFSTRKTGREVVIPLAAPLRRLLAGMQASTKPGAFVHPTLAAHVNASGKASTLSNQFAKLLAKAGLREKMTYEKKGEGRGRDAKHLIADLSFHSLRHSAVSWMKNAGASPSVVQDLIGHDSAEITVREISERLASSAEAVVAKLLPGGREFKGEWVAGDVLGGPGDSLKVHLQGQHVGRWKDWANDDHHGDLLDLWRFSRDLTLPDALKEAKEWLGIADELYVPSPRS